MKLDKKALLGLGLIALAGTASATTIVDTQNLSYLNTGYSITEYTHNAIAGSFSSISLNFKAFDVDSLTGEVDTVWAKKAGSWAILGTLVGLDNDYSTTTFSLDSSWTADVNHGLNVRFEIDSTHIGAFMTPRYSDLVVVTSVPEPETYAMMLVGLGAIGWHARRRKAG